MPCENSEEVFSVSACYNCGKSGHLITQCKVSKPEVNHGRTTTNDTKLCRKTSGENSNKSS